MKKLICRLMRYFANIIDEVLTWCHTAITAPTLLTATVVPPNIILSWIDNATNNTCYMIWRSTDGTNFTLLETVNTADLSTWTDTTSVFGQDYWYKVQACNGSGDTSDFSNTVETSYSETEINFGALYNWHAVNTGNLCPTGWHVPTKVEFETLITNLGGALITGGKLKEMGFVYWNSPNTDATNDVGFNLRGGGYRLSINGAFGSILAHTVLWTSTSFLADWARYYNVRCNSAEIYDEQIFSGLKKTSGQYVRPIKDDAIDPGSVTDYDGNIYLTITIGTQVWMAQNLIVEHYNDGTPIPEVTDGATWAALVTGARCVYDNDPAYM